MGEKLSRRKVIQVGATSALSMAMLGFSGFSEKAEAIPAAEVIEVKYWNNGCMMAAARACASCHARAQTDWENCIDNAGNNLIKAAACTLVWEADQATCEAIRGAAMIACAAGWVGDMMIAAMIWCIENPGQCVLGVIISIGGVLLKLLETGWVVLA